MKKGRLLAKGRTAEIYEWGNGDILKLFTAGFEVRRIRYEATNLSAAHAAGLPVPAVQDVIDYEGRTGIVMERLTGPTLDQETQSRPSRFVYHAHLLAELHARVNACTFADLVPRRLVLYNDIFEQADLPDSLKKPALKMVTEMPEGENFCHGDFHPQNVIITTKGPVIIDWLDAAKGDPLADVARTWWLLYGSDQMGVPLVAKWIMAPFRKRFFDRYVERYYSLRPFSQQSLERWKTIVLTARLHDGVMAERGRLLRRIRPMLSHLS